MFLSCEFSTSQMHLEDTAFCCRGQWLQSFASLRQTGITVPSGTQTGVHLRTFIEKLPDTCVAVFLNVVEKFHQGGRRCQL